MANLFSFRIAAAALGLVLICGLGAVYVGFPSFVDHGEPINAILGHFVLSGRSIYHPFDAEQITTNVYGPAYYGVLALVFSLFGSATATAKLPAIIALALVPVILARAFRSDPAIVSGLAITSCVALIFVALPFAALVRPDALVVLCVAIGVWVTHHSDKRRSGAVQVVGVGVLIGLCLSLKLYAFVALFPVFALVVLRFGFRSGVFVALSAGGTAAVCFAMPYVSLDGFFAWFGTLLADKPSGASVFEKVTRYGVVYAVPALIVLARYRRSWRQETESVVLAVSYLVALGLIAVPASKAGAGVHYLVILAPVAAVLIVRAMRGLAWRSPYVLSGGVVVCVAVVLAFAPMTRFLRVLESPLSDAAETAMAGIAARYQDRTIHVGWGDSFERYKAVYPRVELVFSGQPYFLDPAIAMEFVMLNVSNVDETAARIGSCEIDVWLIPSGEEPFSMRSYYATPAFTTVFHEPFVNAYQRIETVGPFDIWQCVSVD